jgi:hypothetical protein
LFTAEYRDRVKDFLLESAASDPRVVAGAMVGSLALDEGDPWSDLDLTFAVADGTPLTDVLDDWTRQLSSRFGAVHLFDVPSGAAIYRVFLLPDALQVDLSFAPASEFAAAGPKFRLLFGQSVSKPFPRPPSPHELFGYAVHHALRARFCIERRRYWQAEYWISGVRDYALSLACRHRDLPARFGRGFDDLPAAVRDRFIGALVRSLDRDELLRALRVAIDGLLHEVDEVRELAAKVAPELLKLTVPWSA